VKAPFALERLGDEHDRAGFSCDEEALDRYFRTQVTQDVRRRVANCFVAIEADTGVVAGFYTLAAAGVPLSDLPPAVTKRLPRYPTVPAIRVGRLAVDRRFQGRGLGSALLADAATRGLRADVAAFLLLVEAKNENAVAFYEKLGFMRLESHARSLFLALATAEKAWVR
jgi:ribosomal protein S18 acetylase RimI-like enzyme